MARNNVSIFPYLLYMGTNYLQKKKKIVCLQYKHGKKKVIFVQMSYVQFKNIFLKYKWFWGFSLSFKISLHKFTIGNIWTIVIIHKCTEIRKERRNVINLITETFIVFKLFLNAHTLLHFLLKPLAGINILFEMSAIFSSI